LSLELAARRTTPGATSLLVSRRARRPRNQSAQEIGLPIGIEGTFDFELIGHFTHQRGALRQDTVLGQRGKAL
jgi:hypothetical protein